MVEAANTGGTDFVKSYLLSYILPANVEFLALAGSFAIIGRGNELDNAIAGNNINNVLYGESGNDYIEAFGGLDNLNGGAGNDTLDGGVGNDTMTGGAGNDLYYVDSTSDVIVEQLNEG